MKCRLTGISQYMAAVASAERHTHQTFDGSRKIKGEGLSRLFYESQAASVDRIEEIQKSEGIDCDFRRLDGNLFQGDDMPADVIDEELDAVRAAGASVERLVRVTVSGCD